MTLPVVPDGEPKPAPEPLLLVQAFVNTREVGQENDLLGEPPHGGPVAAPDGLLGAEVTAGPEDSGRPRVPGGHPRAAGEERRRPAPTAGELRPRDWRSSPPGRGWPWTPTAGSSWTPARGAGSLTGWSAWCLIIRDAQRDGTWPRLKVCGNDVCLWAFYDRSHSRRGAWCDMAVCGNLIKTRNLRARQGSRSAGNCGPLGGAARRPACAARRG